MPKFKMLKENGEMVETANSSLTSNNCKRYVDEFGSERAEGYLDALRDITYQVNQILFRQTAKSEKRNSAEEVDYRTMTFLVGKVKLMEQLELLVTKPNLNNLEPG